MPLILEERLSDSPYIERVWRARSEQIDTFISVAFSQSELVVWKQDGITQVTLRGPELNASHAPVPNDAEFFGIVFKLGTFMPRFPLTNLIDNPVLLPEATHQSFWLNSNTYQLPDFENAETFVDWLVRDDLLIRDPIIEAVLQDRPPADVSLRTIQRRFLRATGLTHRTLYQIERARHAAILLQEGTPISDVVFDLGYFDHAHLTHSLNHFIGQTPTQLIDRSHQLSLLYKPNFE